MISVLASTALVGGLVACGDVPAEPAGDVQPSASGEPPPTGAGADGERQYQASSTVLEDASHGPELCVGGIMDSYPIQCDGIELVGWDWATVDDSETVERTTWGTYLVTGTWDGDPLTVTDVADPVPDEPPPGGSLAADFASPCEPPPGGWAVLDPATTTDEAIDAVSRYASEQPDYAAHWLDSTMNPAWTEGPFSEEVAMELGDPKKLVLDVVFTGDLDRHEAEIRELWGGALCLSLAERSAAELQAVADELMARDDVLWAYADGKDGSVTAAVVVDDGLQDELDATYGPGLVLLEPQLVRAG